MSDLDLSEDTLLRVGDLLNHLYEEAQYELDPQTMEDEENAAEMNMTFFLYVIKDVLEFTGIFGDKSKGGLKIAAREIRQALHKIEVLTEKAKFLAKVESILDQ